MTMTNRMTCQHLAAVTYYIYIYKIEHIEDNPVLIIMLLDIIDETFWKFGLSHLPNEE